MFRLALVAGLVAYAATVQSQSTQCMASLTNITGNTDASQCLAIPSLLPVITAGNNSIVKPLNAWLVAMCAAPACSNATLAAVVTDLAAGCSTEFNISSNATSLISTVQTLYPTIRKTFCLKHGSTLCVNETLTNIETITGPLSLANIGKIYESPPTSLPTNITCTDCNKESYNIWAKDVPSSVATAKPALESQCGASFVDGSTPSGISQSASTGTSRSATGSAFGLLDILANSAIVATVASGFIALSTVYTLLI